MVRRRWRKGTALLIALGLVTAAGACGDDDDGGDVAAGGDFKPCQVTDEGGVDDDSFNENSYRGMTQAAEELGTESQFLESSGEADYEANITTFVEGDCDLIIGAGFALGGPIATAAQDNPDQNFAIVDYDYQVANDDPEDEFDNVRELTFSTDEAAFLAGYVAASVSQTGTVGTYGGRPFPTVTIFMKGFEAGVAQYNEDTGENVEVVGWSTADDDGLFTGDFENVANGRSTTEQLLDQGADVILPVAGPVGAGSIEAIRAREADASVIWVDDDGCAQRPDDCDLMLTSVLKNMNVAVHDTIMDAAEGNFESGLYVGTLENNGVGIADFNEFDDEVSQEVKDRIEELRDQIIAGEVEPTLE